MENLTVDYLETEVALRVGEAWTERTVVKLDMDVFEV
jgi:hypothetical protein